ncbi:dickkopf-related protein 2-like [Eucyclogobius newberryi]|uniref:dickkopf-related protein 2-like n=1 Tax=Eucyclogobius newberryi TaxID=166745 RepID=UPI003B5BB0B6
MAFRAGRLPNPGKPNVAAVAMCLYPSDQEVVLQSHLKDFSGAWIHVMISGDVHSSSSASNVMPPQVPAALALLLVAAVVALRPAEARVKLNSIRTVILRDSYVLPVNRSIWEPGLDFTMYQCMSDLECREGSYCHSSPKGHAHSRCHSCRRRKRRCHRDGMCCPGNNCSNNICVADADSFVSQRIPDTGGSMSSLASKRSWRKRGRADMKAVAGKGQVGEPCLRSTDCSDGLCCARHFWTRICKPVLQEGQVCTKHRRKGTHGLELFQRCPCGDGLTCRKLKDAQTQPASSLLAAAAANSKLASPFASARHSSPHTSPLSSSKASSASAVAKTRLHVCQRE